jgi:hypothetical protein
MGKYEIEMELTGFRLKVRGERDDLPIITENLQQQVTGLIAPAINIAAGQLPHSREIAPAVTVIESSPKAKRAGRSRRSTSTNGEASKTVVINWDHDPNKWGVPKQAWKAWQKVAWLLYVVSEECNANELSASMIVETFNTHFRQSGLLKQSNMTTQLGRMKQSSPALIGDHATKNPITWFLTETGIQEAKKMVIEAKGGTNRETTTVD